MTDFAQERAARVPDPLVDRPPLNAEIAENGACLARRDAEGRIVDEHGRVMDTEDED